MKNTRLRLRARQSFQSVRIRLLTARKRSLPLQTQHQLPVTKKAYVSFVEVAESKLNYKDNKGSKNILAGVGGGLVGGGAPLIAVGAVYKDDPYVNDLAKSYMTWGGICMGASVPFLIAALLPTKTKVNFTGLYNIYIYDTETKSLIRKEAVSVNCEETFKGSYTYDESSKEIVRDYVSQNVYNALLKKYDELSTWLEKR